MEEDAFSYAVIGAIIEVHRVLGPGMPEGVYEDALALEFQARNIQYERQKAVPVSYKGQLLECRFRLDFLIGGSLILELKAVEQLHPIHEAQLLGYLRLTGCKVGLLVNMNVERAKDGIQRKVLIS
ncbi:MAG: GxxExxY protein [Actinomycetota bacterium]